VSLPFIHHDSQADKGKQTLSSLGASQLFQAGLTTLPLFSAFSRKLHNPNTIAPSYTGNAFHKHARCRNVCLYPRRVSGAKSKHIPGSYLNNKSIVRVWRAASFPTLTAETRIYINHKDLPSFHEPLHMLFHVSLPFPLLTLPVNKTKKPPLPLALHPHSIPSGCTVPNLSRIPAFEILSRKSRTHARS